MDNAKHCEQAIEWYKGQKIRKTMQTIWNTVPSCMYGDRNRRCSDGKNELGPYSMPLWLRF